MPQIIGITKEREGSRQWWWSQDGTSDLDDGIGKYGGIRVWNEALI